ncbi:glycosyltransferase family 2 protein [Actinopolymorpha sp. B11F2]|uniref:glycosyltransferase family 2 protein n=1 Tax=Actinopolymorpha sp. B11F2 TaxID=3160862 RepID=UPI0032E40E12
MDAMEVTTPSPPRSPRRPRPNRPAPGALLDHHSFTYSIVIPVFNSVEIVGTTIDRVVDVLDGAGLSYELILVNDGSRDGSWEVISTKARDNSCIVAIDLLRNYGQHSANLAGFREATGDYVITMDDDLQNPPDQILVLIDAAMRGHDLVFGRFERKQAASYRRLGSKAITLINRRVFGQPADLAVSNFRILRRDVVDRISASQTAYPYITGQALLYSGSRSHVAVRHEPRPVGKSHYSLVRIIRLVLAILFSYSSVPLRLAALCGFVIAAMSFGIGTVYLIRGLVGETQVEGWTTLVVLLAVFNGVTIALLSMLGEYTVRTLNAVSAHKNYHVVDRVSG